MQDLLSLLQKEINKFSSLRDLYAIILDKKTSSNFLLKLA